jgi:hypothetical protein
MMLPGCASPSGAGVHAGEPYIVNNHGALFYSYGASQASGPDFELGGGQQVTMLSYEYGYSHVAVAGTGQTGYVATEDLSHAPPQPKASPTPSLLAAQTRRRHGGDGSRPPAPDEESQIPMPEFPESEPPPNAPPFRY